MTMSKKQSTKTKSPFHTILISSPNEKSAEAALHGPLKIYTSTHTNISTNAESTLHQHGNIISTFDPYVRMGSGGGTLAAISKANTDESILIIHAGGESSRCPTQMCLGKAWTTLPLQKEEAEGVDGLVEQLHHPTGLLILELERLLKDLPKGSIVVAASDVLLYLPELKNGINFADNGAGHVIGVGVPAPLHIAKNHGVFVVEGRNDSNENNSTDREAITSVDRFLQKPTLEMMQSIRGCTFLSSKDQGSIVQETDMAWIDTGVVIFPPPAAKKLRALSQGDLQVCTEEGLKSLYAEKGNRLEESIQVFAKRVAARVDLYSHFMLSLSTNHCKEVSSTIDNRKKRRKEYLSHHDNSDLRTDILESIYDALSDLELKVLLVPGQFIHLGTTQELRNFLTEGVRWNKIKENKEVEEVGSLIEFASRECRVFGKGIGLSQRSKTFLYGVDVHFSSVVYNSVLSVSLPEKGPDIALPTTRIIVSAGTVIEHCHVLVNPFCKLNIGANCLISGLRGKCTENISIPNDMMFQMFPLEAQTKDDQSYVYVYLNINDAIKKRDTCYGISFDRLQQITGISSNDLWDEGAQNILWNARIHPVMMASDIIDWGPLTWITDLINANNNSSEVNAIDGKIKSCYRQWKALKRLSLSEIQKMADTSTEFKFRHLISNEKLSSALQFWLSHLRTILDKRSHDSFDFGFIMDEIQHQKSCKKIFFFAQTLQVLDLTIISNIENSRYDISSRSLMLMSNLLKRIANVWIDNIYDAMNEKKRQKQDMNSNETDIDIIRSWSSKSDEKISACRRLFERRDFLLDAMTDVYALSKFSVLVEKAAFAFTELCVSNIRHAGCGMFTVTPTDYSTRPGIWSIATAPARIDLSGGWSDTPPISYEFGGAVSCLAVLVDGKKPLSARCRKLSNYQGIILCTESRDSMTGKLLGSESVHIDNIEGLANFRDPLASCALLKCALICTGLVPINTFGNKKKSLQPYIKSFCKHNDSSDIGLELISTSLLPRGSGMGTSSILAGCVLSAINNCIHSHDTGMRHIDKKEELDSLVQHVLLLEQMLSTGGGWQDQVGGLCEGLKLGVSNALKVPLQIKINRIALSPDIQRRLNDRLLLAFTGQPRLAKNILQTVVRRWARRSPDILQTVYSLVAGAHKSVEAIQKGDLDALGKQLSLYWSQKKSMAGLNSGVEPAVVNQIFSHLQEHKLISGGTLVGAGGGGFMALILQEGKTRENVTQSFKISKKLMEATNVFTWHSCIISIEGLTITKGQQGQLTSCNTKFDFNWHS